MYRLATMHGVTDGQTDREHHDANSLSCRMQWYDRLKINNKWPIIRDFVVDYLRIINSTIALRDLVVM